MLLLLSAGPHRAAAIGGDSNDFLVNGGTNFPNRIRVFDFGFSFKGYLDTNFLGLPGMRFDRARPPVPTLSFGCCQLGESSALSPVNARV